MQGEGREGQWPTAHGSEVSANEEKENKETDWKALTLPARQAGTPDFQIIHDSNAPLKKP